MSSTPALARLRDSSLNTSFMNLSLDDRVSNGGQVISKPSAGISSSLSIVSEMANVTLRRDKEKDKENAGIATSSSSTSQET